MNQPQTKICLFGGTFDPIHLGHTYIASQALRHLNLDKVVFLPCRQSPHKTHTQSVSEAHRLTMCQLAVQNLPWAEVSNHDLLAPAPSYSWRTAEHFKTIYPNAEIFWLMGSDQWQALPRWNKAEYFSKLVNIVVYSRGNLSLSPHPFPFTPLASHLHPASATHIRTQVAKAAQNIPWIAPQVAAYIKENNLYRKSHLD